jgi:hypothetical protein
MMTQKVLKDLEIDPRLTIKKLFNSVLGKEFQEISTSLQIKNPRQLLFHYQTNIQQIPLCICKNSLTWNQDLRKYRSYCSKSCSAKYTVEQKKKNNLSKLGVEWHSQTDEWKEKVINTSLSKFGKKHYSLTEQFQDSVLETNNKKYGVDYPSQSKEIYDKIVEHWLNKYQVTNPFYLKTIQEKIKKTNKKKYGVEYASQNEAIKEKTKETNIKKYGVDNPSKVENFITKRTNSFKENFYDQLTLEKINNPEWLKNENLNNKTVTEISKDLGVSNSNLGKYYKKYGIDIISHKETLDEKILREFLENYSINAEYRTRNIIKPYELDCYISECNLAIEINGVYWHSEQFNKDKKYHVTKTNKCQEQKIELWHFWDFEFQEKQQLIFNKLLVKLGISNKIGARKLKIKLVDHKEKKIFFENNHLQGDAASSVNIGLYFNNVLLMCCSFSKARFSKKYQWELIRLSTQQTYVIPGGASKLLKYFIDNYMKDNEILVSYCNRRFSSGNLYKKLNFNLVSSGEPGYCYVYGNKIIGSRNAWQKHLLKNKIKIYDQNLSERENMEQNNFYRLWDCGQDTWILKK